MRQRRRSRYPLLAFEIERLEIISRQVGQPLCAEHCRESLITLRHFRVGGCGARIVSLTAQFPLAKLAAGEIMAFGSLHHLPRTQDWESSSKPQSAGCYSGSGPMTLCTSLMLMTGGKERTEAEYRRLLESAGLRVTRVLGTATAMSILEARRA